MQRPSQTEQNFIARSQQSTQRSINLDSSYIIQMSLEEKPETEPYSYYFLKNLASNVKNVASRLFDLAQNLEELLKDDDQSFSFREVYALSVETMKNVSPFINTFQMTYKITKQTDLVSFLPQDVYESWISIHELIPQIRSKILLLANKKIDKYAQHILVPEDIILPLRILPPNSENKIRQQQQQYRQKKQKKRNTSPFQHRNEIQDDSLFLSRTLSYTSAFNNIHSQPQNRKKTTEFITDRKKAPIIEQQQSEIKNKSNNLSSLLFGQSSKRQLHEKTEKEDTLLYETSGGQENSHQDEKIYRFQNYYKVEGWKNQTFTLLENLQKFNKELDTNFQEIQRMINREAQKILEDLQNSKRFLFLPDFDQNIKMILLNLRKVNSLHKTTIIEGVIFQKLDELANA